MGANLSFPVVDLNGKVAVITGGNAGIGYETAKALAIMGAHTIIACRSSERANAAVEQMKQEISIEFPNKTVTIEWMLLELSSFHSTKDFTVAFREKNLPLHILINNAGISSLPLTMTEDGYEAQFQVNHLSHFLLTLELLPIILDTASNCGDCRIVIVSSSAHLSGVFEPGNMNAEVSYSRMGFYFKSKLYNVMHGYALQRRLQNVGITVSSLHPGFVDTDIVNKGLNDSSGWSRVWRVSKFLMSPIIRDTVNGAATSINCAINPELNSQQCFYYKDTKASSPLPISMDVHLQEQLWEISINIVKEWVTPEVLEKYGATIETTSPVQEDTPTQTQETTGTTEEGIEVQVPPTLNDTPETQAETEAMEELQIPSPDQSKVGVSTEPIPTQDESTPPSDGNPPLLDETIGNSPSTDEVEKEEHHPSDEDNKT